MINEEVFCSTCICDHWTCKKFRNSFSYVAWRMWGITFGVDPKITEILHKKGETVVVQEKIFNFCDYNKSFYEDFILALIVKHCHCPGNIKEICTSADFQEGLGCWITIIDVLDGHPVRNFQFPYDVFAKIYTDFYALPFEQYSSWHSWQKEAIQDLKRLIYTV